jgi:uncharacterized membrane protein YcaP (DUF421 family)
MKTEIIETLKIIIGSERINLVVAMSMRGIILYALSMLSIRFNKKFLGIRTSSNFILFVMLGSMSAAAVTEEGLFLPIVFTIIILSAINKVISSLFFYFPWLEHFFTGKPVTLISNGEIQWHNMKTHFITRNDLLNALQTQLHTDSFSKVDFAYLAIDGTINFIIKS